MFFGKVMESEEFIPSLYYTSQSFEFKIAVCFLLTSSNAMRPASLPPIVISKKIRLRSESSGKLHLAKQKLKILL